MRSKKVVSVDGRGRISNFFMEDFLRIAEFIEKNKMVLEGLNH